LQHIPHMHDILKREFQVFLDNNVKQWNSFKEEKTLSSNMEKVFTENWESSADDVILI
jgi:hypothetical protein